MGYDTATGVHRRRNTVGKSRSSQDDLRQLLRARRSWRDYRSLGKFKETATPTKHLYMRFGFDFTDAPAAVIRELAVFIILIHV